MGPPTTAQRIDLIEEKMANLELGVKEMVSTAVTEMRHYHETLLNSMRNEQLKFQAEMKSTMAGLTSLQVPMGEKLDPSVNHIGSNLGNPNSILGASEEMGIGSEVRNFGGGIGLGGGSGGGPGGGGTNWRYRKLDMPLFDGSDPDGWVLRVERYFNFYKMNEGEMLDAAAVAMEGDALRWFQWENNRRPIRRWADLKLFVIRQFRSLSGGSLYEQWLSTVQTSTVLEHRRKFIETAAPLERVSEDMLLGHFVNGLKEEVRAEVRLMNPVSLEHAMELAVRVEEKQRVASYKKTGLGSIKTGGYSVYSKGSLVVSPYSLGMPTSPPLSRSWGARSPESQASVRTAASTVTTAHSGGDIKRLTEKELQDKRAKGLCYRCDAKWAIGHRCKKKELSVMLIEEEEGETDCEDTEAPPSPTEEITTEVSLNSVIGLSNPKTMKLRGLIGDQDVVVMIDPGATHNFISLSTVASTGVPVMKEGSFGVSLGNGEAIRGDGVCRGVRLQLDGGLEVEEDFLPLQLGSSDIILGIQWLEKLGMVLTNRKTQVMKFEIKGEPITLVGDPSLVKSQISLKAMRRVLRKGNEGFLVECNIMEGSQNRPTTLQQTTKSQPAFISKVLEQHATVFEEPVGLPPSRGHEHAITLKEGSNPIGVRPYRYPQNQKDEIERLIHEMLGAGIIKPSTSPFSSPVLLVKKMMGHGDFAWIIVP